MSKEKHSQNDASKRSTAASIIPARDITDRVVTVRVLPGSKEPIAVSIKVSKSPQVEPIIAHVTIETRAVERSSNLAPKTKGGAS